MTETTTERRVKITRADQVRAVPQRFILDDLIPCDVLTLVAGIAGEGKSTLTLDYAAKLTRGTLPGVYYGEPANVAIMAIEDAQPMIKARLLAAGADLRCVGLMDVTHVVGGEDLEDRPRFPDDIVAVRDALVRQNIRMLIIDPITSAIEGDTNKRDQVRAALDPLHALARELGIAIVCVLHFGKGGGRASEKISGSHAFRDIARSVILLATDPDSGERIMTLDKSNYSSAAGTSWKFSLVDTTIIGDDDAPIAVARVEHLGESDTSVQDLINRDPQDTGDDDDRNAAQTFVLDYLRGKEAWEAPARDVIKAGHAAGFSEQELKNARKRCRDPKIASQKSGFGAGWVWAINADEDHESTPEDHEGVTKESKVSRARERDPYDTFGLESDTFMASPAPVCPACDSPAETIEGYCATCHAALIPPKRHPSTATA